MRKKAKVTNPWPSHVTVEEIPDKDNLDQNDVEQCDDEEKELGKPNVIASAY